MPAWKLVDADLQALLCDATLELDRKEPILAPGNDVDRHCGPRLESAGLAEPDIRLGAILPLALLEDLGRNVVQEVRREVEVRAVTTALRRRPSRFLPPGVGPPRARRFGGDGAPCV